MKTPYILAAAAAASTMLTPVPEFGRKGEDNGGGGDDKTLETLQKQLGETLGEVKQFATEFREKTAAGDKIGEEAKEKADKALSDLEGLRGEITELSQKLAQGRRGGGDGNGDEAQLKSLGFEVANHPDIKAFAENGSKGTVGITVKAITSASGSGGGLITLDRQPGIVGLQRPQLRVRDLLTPGRTTSNGIEYAYQTTRTNNAAPVAETTQKPESAYAWEVDTAPVRTIAHWVPASRQAMDDIPQLESLIDGELRWGLDDVEDGELLLGDGTGQHLEGLYTQATAYSAPLTIAGATRIDQLRLAILQVELADYAPDGIVLHPTAWAGIELTKDAAGGYIFANPQGIAGPVLWGRPVVSTKRIGAGNFLTGAFKLAAQIFDRMDTEVRISDQDRDNFIKNMLTVRAEKRLALVVRRPGALVKGALVALPS